MKTNKVRFALLTAEFYLWQFFIAIMIFCISYLLEVVIVGWWLHYETSGCTKCSLSAAGDRKNIAKKHQWENWLDEKRHEKKQERARQARMKTCKPSLVGGLGQLNHSAYRIRTRLRAKWKWKEASVRYSLSPQIIFSQNYLNCSLAACLFSFPLLNKNV